MRPITLALLALCGCGLVTSAKKVLDNLTDEQLAQHTHDLAFQLVSNGVKFAYEKFPKADAQIKADGAIADKVLRDVVIPLFSKAPLGTVAAGALTTGLDQFKAKLSGSTLDLLVFGSTAILGQVTLPANPTDKISPRAHAAIQAFFTGMAEGDEKALSIPGPSTGPPAPPPPPK